MTSDMKKGERMKTGAQLIAIERERQINEEDWDDEHDDEHQDGDLARAAICYAAQDRIFIKYQDGHNITFRDPWPGDWDDEWDKRHKHGPIRRLVIAGALIAAEIDKMYREAQ